MFSIKSVFSGHQANDFRLAINKKIANKTKPIGALGQLEMLAEHLAMIQSVGCEQYCQQININQPTAVVFAGDHGIAKQNVSIAPSDVTRQMVLNFLHGGAAINCFCRTNNVELVVVDAGITVPLTKEECLLSSNFVEQRLGAGTNDISQSAAMSTQQVEQGLMLGKALVEKLVADGCNTLLIGEMGIANTSAASAIYMALSGNDVDDCVGQGTGISAEQLADKKRLISQAVTRAKTSVDELTPLNVLAQLAGFEIVQMVGAMLGAAQAGMTIIVDGFIVTSAALVAEKINSHVKDYLVFSHQSDEKAHRAMLNYFQATPLLSLGLRLGEGTGAALALPLLRASASFYNDMASFESAGVVV